MTKIKNFLILTAAMSFALIGYAKKKDLSEYVQEEAGLSVTKITNEEMNSVLGPTAGKTWLKFGTTRSTLGGSKKGGMQWNTHRLLAVSPDGTEIAYLTRKNKADNIMVRKATGGGASTQRTFRNVRDFCWGPDDNLYLSDYVDDDNQKIAALDAHKGSTMRQLTSNNVDFNPATRDGENIFFTRWDNTGPSIWCFNIKNGELLNCTRGYQPTPISKKEFLCTRNSTDGNSEIWLVNYVDGQETLIMSAKDMGFSNASLSPDGKWILMQANTKSSATKKQNLDIFVVRPDGTQMTQITYHPANDFCPVWSADGKQIYFISSRGSKDDSYNVWRLNFRL